ncbi:MAG: hypothetical protein HGA22_12100, partial [Clostridiales bacterium]|nr:hypothetical protein [Clostridiales bacterium]
MQNELLLSETEKFLVETANRYKGKTGGLLLALEEIKKVKGKITPEALRILAEGMSLTLAQVYEVCSFYSEFNPDLESEGPADFRGLSDRNTEGVLLETAKINNPASAEEYAAAGGYNALKAAIASPETILAAIEAADLRGRSGAAFPVSVKWKLVKDTPSDVKYVICNGSEGEPGTCKDLLLMLQTPHAIIEGMAICAIAVSASKGYIYVRSDYTQAEDTLLSAIKSAAEAGYIGDSILGSGMKFNIEVIRGAGAYVCGEETALLETLEGRRGEPRLKPPFPGTAGLWGKPTVINNTESFACIPAVIKLGAKEYGRSGTGCSAGTRLYSVSGCVKYPGEYEYPMGTSMRILFEEAGGGSPYGKRLKGIQIGGGASGSIISADQLDTALDTESCQAAGMALGTGSLYFF